jgi:hypothetical protein
VLYRGGIYDQQDATNSQYLFLEVLYMFRAIIAHHQEIGTVCAAINYLVASGTIYLINNSIVAVKTLNAK